MSFAMTLAIARRWWWLALGALVLSGSLAYLLTAQLTPIYRAEAVILVNQAQNPARANYQDILGSQQLTKTYAQLVTSTVNLEQALEALAGVYDELALEALEENVTASAVRDTQLIRIAAEDADPHRAAAIASTVAEVFPCYIEEAQLAGDDESGAGVLNTIFVAESAQVPSSPVRPSLPVNVAIGVLLGLLVVAAIIAVVEYFDDGVNDREDVQRLDVPFLGSVLQASRPKGVDKEMWVPNVAGPQRDEALTESYRQVQANLMFALGANDAKVLLVTSANPSEGKSTTSANLATTLAESSKRVLLIDGDLRKPVLHRYFSLPNSSGLSTAFVVEPQSVRRLLKQITPTFFVLTAGPVPPNPAELLGSRKMASMLEELAQPFDIVVIDSPPILRLADASVLTAMADGVVLVARRGKTHQKDLEDAAEVIRSSRKPLLGVVLNGSKRHARRGYYGYGYGEGAQQPAQSRWS